MQWQTVSVLPICTRKMWHHAPYGEKGRSEGNIFTKKQIKNKNGPSFVQFTYSNSQGTDFSQFKLIAITFITFHLPRNKMIASKPINNLPSTSSRSRFLSMATKSQELLDNGQLSRRTCAWIMYLWIYKYVIQTAVTSHVALKLCASTTRAGATDSSQSSKVS